MGSIFGNIVKFMPVHQSTNRCKTLEQRVSSSTAARLTQSIQTQSIAFEVRGCNSRSASPPPRPAPPFNGELQQL